MIEYINMYVKITCDKCGNKQIELEPESNGKFFNAGWSMNRKAKKYVHKCGKCNGKHSPVKVWRVVEPMLKTHPLIKSVTNISS